MGGASVRYIVDDLDRAVEFYTAYLAFEIKARPTPDFAILERGDLRLLLNTPGGGGGAGEAMADGSLPEPGGWNRFQIEVENLDATVRELRGTGASFRNDIFSGKGGMHILLEDSAGNLVELFEAWPTHAHTYAPDHQQKPGSSRT